MVIALALPKLNFQINVSSKSNVAPDQMPPSVTSNLGVHFLFRRICL